MENGVDHFIISRGPRKGEKIILSNLPLTFGRLAPADIVIEEKSVSRNHLRISIGENGYVIEDLGSSNGTYVNKQKILGTHYLVNGDSVGLGPEVELVLVATEMGGEGRKAAGESEIPISKISTELISALPSTNPQIIVRAAGQGPKIYTLTNTRIRIGRQPDNDVVIDNPFVSRYQAELEKRDQNYFLIPSANITNPMILDGNPVEAATPLYDGAKIRVGGFSPGEIVTIDFVSSEKRTVPESKHLIKFIENKSMIFGRDPESDVILSVPSVSRMHAEVEKIGTRYRVRDLRSSNGTFVNGIRVEGETWAHAGDAIQIGPYRFVVDENDLARFGQSEGGMQIEAFRLNKWVNKKLNIIQDISLVFRPREFVVVVGQSGGGKSTLVDAIAGYRPATHGKVIVNETIDVYKEFDAIRTTIGYVPQKDIIHMELTVFQALDYAARLRMPADMTEKERNARIEEVLRDLDLTERKDTQISELSGGQQKRISIGVELLTKPGLFFLDEPTSGLDPGMETELMWLMRRLADQGRTIVLITHATKNVMLADKVVFLARGGHLAWFGPPDEALAYFDEYRSDRNRRSGPMEFDAIYKLLDQPELGKPADWGNRFKNHPAYGKYIGEPLSGKISDLGKVSPQVTAKRPTQPKRVSALNQLIILSQRNLTILTRDRFTLALMILTAPAMASLDFILASGVGRNPFGFYGGDFNHVIITMIVLTNTAILVGGMALMRELVKEREIYRRERMVNLRLSSYITSKLWFALVLAVYQATCFTVIHYIAFDMPGGVGEAGLFYITTFLLVVAGMMMGLFSSALAPNANAAPLLMILFVIPQMVLSGALVPLPDFAKAFASSRWAFQTYIGISGAGSDVAADSCWDLTEEQRDQLSLEQKNANCNCMGENALHQNSCNFPGLGEYYTEAIDEADPLRPSAPGPQPTQPHFPPEPAKPADPNNLLLLQKYLSDLGSYENEVSQIRNDFQEEMNAWQNEQEQYKTLYETYQTVLTELQVKRAIAIGSAESTIQRYEEDYGWTFVDKESRKDYFGVLVSTWSAQLVLILVFFTATVFIQKRREVV